MAITCLFVRRNNRHCLSISSHINLHLEMVMRPRQKPRNVRKQHHLKLDHGGRLIDPDPEEIIACPAAADPRKNVRDQAQKHRVTAAAPAAAGCGSGRLRHRQHLAAAAAADCGGREKNLSKKDENWRMNFQSSSPFEALFPLPAALIKHFRSKKGGGMTDRDLALLFLPN